jgi:hypothetical protein
MAKLDVPRRVRRVHGPAIRRTRVGAEKNVWPGSAVNADAPERISALPQFTAE